MTRPPITHERRLELIDLACTAVTRLLHEAPSLGVEDTEMALYWGLFTEAVLALGASMEGAKWMERVVQGAVDAAKKDFDMEQADQAGRN